MKLKYLPDMLRLFFSIVLRKYGPPPFDFRLGIIESWDVSWLIWME